MRPSLSSVTGAALFAAATSSTALAGGTEFLEYTIALTNPTGTGWAEVLFVIEPDANAMANDPDYAALFDDVAFPQVVGPGGQSVDGKSAQVWFDDARFDDGEHEVLFQFEPDDPFVTADGFVLFNLTIETPDALGVPFEIRVEPIFVPSPGSAALFGLGLGLVAMNRRRSA